METKLHEIHKEALNAVEKIADLTQLEEVRNTYLSRKSELTNIKKNLKDLTNEEKRIIGPLANKISSDIEEKLSECLKKLQKAKKLSCKFCVLMAKLKL